MEERKGRQKQKEVWVTEGSAEGRADGVRKCRGKKMHEERKKGNT